MKIRITDALAKVHAVVDDFQLLAMTFPSSLSNALEVTQEKKTDIETFKF